MSVQSRNGKAFEYAIATAFSKALNVQIIVDSSSITAKNAYLSLPADMQAQFASDANKAVTHVLENLVRNIRPANIKISADSAGASGDPRDVIIRCLDGKEVGISCKTNHEDVKHSRLSKTIDWVKKWDINPDGCSETYWSTVNPIFDFLAAKKKTSNSTALWQELDDKNAEVYTPILDAWSVEALAQCGANGEGKVQDFFRYLTGKQDLLKIMRFDDIIKFEAYNADGTLDGISTTVLPSSVTSIIETPDKTSSRLMMLDSGWQFNFRIHNASSRIEPSLKFAVSLHSKPEGSIYSHQLTI